MSAPDWQSRAEAGPEAVLPLRRTRTGDLGVNAQITGGMRQVIFNTPISVIAGPGSGNNDNRQDTENNKALGELLRREVENTVKKVMQDERRAGGILGAGGGTNQIKVS